MGEGEQTFTELCECYAERTEFSKIQGITFRTEDGDIIANPWRMPMDLSKVPFVYNNMKDFEHKIVYYETSRGCPFSVVIVSHLLIRN